MNKPFSVAAEDMVDQTVGSAEATARATRRMADSAIDNVEAKLRETRERVAPAAGRLAAQAEAAARHGLDAMRDGAHRIRSEATYVGDRTVNYVRDEPVKSILIAATIGALIALLAGLSSRRH